MIPSDDVLAGFDRFVVSVEAMLWKNEEENRRLSGIRDSLLPKLMAGEVAV